MVLPGGKNFLYRLSRQYEKQFAERSNETLPLRLYVPPIITCMAVKREKKNRLPQRGRSVHFSLNPI